MDLRLVLIECDPGMTDAAGRVYMPTGQSKYRFQRLRRNPAWLDSTSDRLVGRKVGIIAANGRSFASKSALTRIFECDLAGARRQSGLSAG